MDIQIHVQSTPNPNALKFILNTPVKTEGKAAYKTAEECHANPLARYLFAIPNVSEVYFFDNVITVTQDGNADWDGLELQVKNTILEKISEHNPNFTVDSEKKKPAPTSPDLVKIEEILDRTIRPALQGDGGDLQVMGLEGNVLTVNYQGACGSCPSSTMGTLKAIEGILREEFKPDLVVQAV
ncbi:MAG: NifU family protein [Candidatus Omnitrophota bacterium]